MKNKSMIDRCVLIWNSALTEVLECQTHAKSQKTGLLHFVAMFSAWSEALLHSKPTENPSAVSLTELVVYFELQKSAIDKRVETRTIGVKVL